MNRFIAAIAFALTPLAVSASAQCPTLKVIGPAGLTNAGENMVFRAEIEPSIADANYLWTTTTGTIIDGQGTPTITVATSNSVTETAVIATVKVERIPDGCDKSVSESAPMSKPPPWCWDLDQYAPLKPNDERARLDTFFADLSNNPTHVGLIVLRITPRERADASNRRIQFIVKHARFRRFDVGRFLFALERSDEQRTILVRIIPGGMMPPCENCEFIKGGEIR